MKKTFYSFSILTLFVVCISLTTATPPAAGDPGAALKAVTEQFHTGLTAMSEAVAAYHQAADALDGSTQTVEALQKAHLETRLAFKDIEFLLEYFDHDAVKIHLNGAPLPSVEPAVPEIRILEPTGLQVLDELVFADDPTAEREAINELVGVLKNDFKNIKTYQQNLIIQHRHVFEAMRYELIRIFTLGVTGFDTPGSVNALPEARRAMVALREAARAYQPLIREKDEALAKSISRLFLDAVNYLGNQSDFDSFDRLTFLKTFINPLYGKLLRAQRGLGIEMIDETDQPPHALNHYSENLFAEDFLDPYFYTGFVADDVNEKRIDLGRLLFYDPILSSNNKRACASCHQPERAFTDGQRKSLAMDFQGTIDRNAPTLVNSVFAGDYFYDLREPSLDRQVHHVVVNEAEFNTDFDAIVEKLRESETYNQLFAEAYREHQGYELSAWTVSNGLAAFVAELRTFNSPFDQYVRGELDHIEPAVARGFNLFMGKGACGTCHFAPTFNGTVPPHYHDSESEVLGVPATKDEHNPEVDPDGGRAASGKPRDGVDFYVHSFKTVTVRNAALTAPYMHNGVYDTLEEVMDFYNKGGGAGLGIELEHQTLPPDPLNLTETEISDMVAFMEALTDTTGLTSVPVELPAFEGKPEWNDRKIGGEY